MVLNQGQQMNVTDRSNAILEAIFGKDKLEEDMTDSFSVFNSGGNNVGKIYLSIHVSLKGLVDANLPFKWDTDVRETKVVIHY